MRRSTAFRAGPWLATALAAALTIACVDGPTSPGRFGELRIRPSYAEGDGPTALGFAVDSARVRIARVSELGTPLVDSMVAYSSDTASLAWLLDLLEGQETMRVDVTVWSGGERLYSGDREVQVSDGAIGADAAELPVVYVGPPIVATLTVAPATVVFDALGGSVTLAAEARDRQDQVVSTAISWTSDDDAIAQVDPATGVVTARRNGTTTVRASAGGKQDSATVVVEQRVTTVAVTPSATTLTALGASERLSAQAKDSRGNVVEGTAFTWTTSAPAVATVDADGQVTAVAGGNATITATGAGIAGMARVKVNPTANVASIVVSPSSVSVTAVGATRQFTAIARDANGQDLTGVEFEWTSSAVTVASIDGVTGMATAAGHGTTTVTATAGAVSSTASLSVDLSTSIASVVVTPGATTLTAVGAVQQFTAEARDVGGAVVPVATFAWSTATPGVASIDASSGLATASAHGATMIVASAGGVSGSASLTVSLAAQIATVVVTPGATTLTSVGAVQQFTAEALDATGTVVPVTAFEWTSSAPAVASVGPSSGLATAAAHGTTTITASVGAVSGGASLGVSLTASIASIVVSPSSSSLTAIGATRQFTAVARDASESPLPGVEFTWTTGASQVASIDPVTGVASAVGDGTTSVTATAGSVAGSASLTVDLSTMIAVVVVTPGATTLTSVGAVQQFTAEARDAGGAVVPVSSFQWTTSAPEVAGVGATGLATAAAHGVTTIGATAGGVSGSATLTVSLAAQIATVVVSPGTALLTGLGTTQQFTAEARDANGAVVPVAAFDWTSSAPQVAIVNPATGLATAAGQGATTISASAGGVSGGASLDVNLTQRIASIMVSPIAAQLAAVGATQQFTAEARDANGVLLPGVQFSWSSGSTDVATIDPLAGMATAVGHGATTVSATAGSVAGTASLTVDLSTSIVSVVVTPGATTLTAVGAVQQFTAEALDANGTVVPVAAFAWSSATPGVATVDTSTGLATAAAHGATTIVASVAGITGAADLVVDLAASVATIVVTPASFTLTSLGATRQYAAEALDANGEVLPGVPVSWTSSATGVATIDPATGLASAAGHGASTIVATSGTVSGNATLIVDLSSSIVTIEVTPPNATLTVLFSKQHFTAVARDANGAVVPGVVFAWSSTLPSVASIEDLNGTASALANGVTTIVATAGTVSGTATLTVQVP